MLHHDNCDTKALYEDVFKEFYVFGEKLRTEGLPASEGEPALLPFKLTHNTDMKAAWILSSKGGGCKTKEFFCTLCPCTKHSLVSYKIGDERCHRCMHRNRKKFYHHQVCDSVQVPQLLRALEAELSNYHRKHGKSYASVRQKLKIRSDHMQADKENDVNHIDYTIPPGHAAKHMEYSQFISRECRIRGIPLIGTLDEWRIAL